MKNSKFIVIVFLALVCNSCSSDDNIILSDVTLQFTHNWDGTQVTNSDFNTIKFTNANGEQVSIERLRYLISKVVFTDANGVNIPFTGYNLVDVTNSTNLSYELPQKIANGTYRVSFVFGFTDEDNQDGIYQDLNSASFNVPAMLGGGYHYMQFDGKYTSTSTATPQNFNYHAIRAVNRTDPNNLTFQDTSILVNLGSVTVNGNTNIEVKMNIAEWFKSPNTWDLNILNTVLMPNFDAQLLMNQNGQNVFSLGEVTQ